jgi:hypothetical protein
LFCFVFSASIVNCLYDDTESFQTAFAIMVVAVFCQCGWLVLTRVSHPHVVRELLWLGVYGSGAYSVPP